MFIRLHPWFHFSSLRVNGPESGLRALIRLSTSALSPVRSAPGQAELFGGGPHANYAKHANATCTHPRDGACQPRMCWHPSCGQGVCAQPLRARRRNTKIPSPPRSTTAIRSAAGASTGAVVVVGLVHVPSQKPGPVSTCWHKVPVGQSSATPWLQSGVSQQARMVAPTVLQTLSHSEQSEGPLAQLLKLDPSQMQQIAVAMWGAARSSIAAAAIGPARNTLRSIRRTRI